MTRLLQTLTILFFFATCAAFEKLSEHEGPSFETQVNQRSLKLASPERP